MSDKPVPLEATQREINRVTVVSTIHHERTDDRPISIPLTFSEDLTVNEESFSRRMVAVEDWQLLIPNFGFLDPKQVGLLIIESLVGGRRQLNPTEEQKESDKKKVLVVGCEPFFMVIRPRRHLYFETLDAEQLMVRCLSGDAKYRVTVLPR